MPGSGRAPGKKRSKLSPAPAIDPATSLAEAAQLHYVTDSTPGIRRRRRGKRFIYLDAEGTPVREPAEIARINQLAIPPAYEAVWICPDPLGHLQATGRDARGRKQYRYHPRWIAARNADKYCRMIGFGRALPKIRAAIDADLARPGLNANKVMATVVALLDRTGIRIGNPRYARENDSFGLTTLENRHVDVHGDAIRFQFRGKSGVEHDLELNAPRLARILKIVPPGRGPLPRVSVSTAARTLLRWRATTAREPPRCPCRRRFFVSFPFPPPKEHPDETRTTYCRFAHCPADDVTRMGPDR